MDPISAIGLLASISTLIQASKGALDLLRSFRDAEQDLADLAIDLGQFDEALRGFERVFRSRQTKHHVSGDLLRKTINDGNATLAEVEKRLTQVYKSESPTLRRVPPHSGEFAFFNTSRGLQRSVLESKPSPRSCMLLYLDKIGTGVVPPDDATLSPALCKTQSRSSCSNEALSFSGAKLAVDSASSREASVASSASSVTSTTLSHDHQRRSSDSQASDLRSAVSAKSGLLVIRRECKHDCYCKCHEHDVAESKSGFSRLNARIFHHSSQLKSECSDPTCAGAAMQKPIPISSFKRAMLHLIPSNSIKIRYRLNTYRMVPVGSNAMRYVKHGNLPKLKAAIQSGEATPWDTASDGWSLLHTAAYARQLESVQYLVELGGDTANVIRKPVDLAFLKSIGPDATQAEKDLVDVFSKEDDYIDDYEFTPIHIAVFGLYEHSDPERPTLQRLIDFVDNANDAPPDTNWAAWKTKYHHRSPLYVSIIEQYRASAAETGNTSRAIHNLIDQKDRKFHWTPLHSASVTGQAQKMKILVQNGADPFIQSNLSFKIIHAAVESNACESLRYALEISKHHPEQLNLNQANIWGETPLIIAAQGCRVGCVKLLLDAGADRNVRQENQQVALHYAGLSGRAERRRETAALLCNQNGTELEIDAQDEDGRPPIFDFLDDPGCFKILIKHGARLD